MFQLYKISCFLIIWTRINYGGAMEASTSRYEGVEPGGTTPAQNPVGAFNQELQETKHGGIDATVRNFFPVKGKQKWMRREFPPVAEMLFFNTSAVGDNEEVTLAQLHLHRRRLVKTHLSYHKKLLPTPYRVVLYQVQPNYRFKSHEDARTMKLASVPVSHATRGGWHTLDVTAVLRELLINAQGPAELLLGVQFEAPKRLDRSYSPLVPLRHFLKTPGLHTFDHPYKTFSYLVVFSEIDPYFEEEEEEEKNDSDNETPNTTRNSIPTPNPSGKHFFKERHLKHKIFKGKESENDLSSNSILNSISGSESTRKKSPATVTKDKSSWKYKKMENEVLKSEKNDVIRHKGKHRGSDVRRSKADEMALKEKTKLKSMPFLHTNEVEEIRQTSRKLTRSLLALGGPNDAAEPIHHQKAGGAAYHHR